eukprot:9604862-Heterocapsa_arctica.AAC.1
MSTYNLLHVDPEMVGKSSNVLQAPPGRRSMARAFRRRIWASPAAPENWSVKRLPGVAPTTVAESVQSASASQGAAAARMASIEQISG